jgi:hypothetical protein
MDGVPHCNSISHLLSTIRRLQTQLISFENKHQTPAIYFCYKSGYLIADMDSIGRIASSRLTISLFPTQLFVVAGLLGVVVLSNAKSLLFAWHVKSALPAKCLILTTAGTTLPTACTAFPSTTQKAYSNKRATWRRVPLCTGCHLFVYPSS